MRNALALSKHFDGIFRKNTHAEERNSKKNGSNFRFQESQMPKGEKFPTILGMKKSLLKINRHEKEEKLKLVCFPG